MKKIKLYFYLLIFYLCICGCFEDISNPLTDIGEPIVQTEIPTEVLAALKLKTDETHQWIRSMLASTSDQEGVIEAQELILENGFDKVDFHELQKAYYKRYIDAGGIAIVGPDTLADEDLIYARNAIVVMTSKHPELRERLLSKHGTFYMVLVLYWDDMLDIPERQLTLSFTRARRGLTKDEYIHLPASCSASTGPRAPYKYGFCYGPTWTRPTPDKYKTQPCEAFVHEFAHALKSEIERLKPGFMQNFAELEEIYDNRGTEILAMGATAWFFSIHPDRKYKTYEEFFEVHPLLAPLLNEWFPRVSLNVKR